MESLKIIWGKWKDGTVHEMWEEWKWIYSYARNYKMEIVFYIFLGLFGTVFSLVSSVASKNLIDIVTGYQHSKITTMAAIMIGMSLFSLFFSSICSRISLKINIKIQNDIQADIFDKIVTTNWLDLSKYPTGDVLSRFGSDVGTIAGSAISWFPNLITNGFRFLCTLILIMYYDPAMALITVANAPIMLVSSKILLNRMRKYTTKVKEMNSEVMQFQQETFNNMDSVKSFGLTDLFSRRLRGYQQRYKDVNLEYNMLSIKTNIVLSILGMLVQFVAYGWGVYRLWTGYITYGEMTLFLTQEINYLQHLILW